MLDPTTYRRTIPDDVDALIDACDDLDVPVPSCPGWARRDLVVHAGRVHLWAAECLRSGTREKVRRPRGPDAGTDPLPWFRDASRYALDQMSDADLDRLVYTWAGDRPVSWWLRRLAHETAIHRWDAEASVGPATGFAPSFAGDGVEEFLTEYVGAFADLAEVGPGEASVSLSAVDANADWRIEFGPTRVAVTPRRGDADVSVRASASDLILLLWKRRDLAGLEVVGDRSVFDRWQRVVSV